MTGLSAPHTRTPGEMLRAVQEQLGHQLPTAYVDLARRHNGGLFLGDAHPAPSRTSWAEDHVGVYTLAAVGRTARFGLCGEIGSACWVAEWGYPDIGVYIADCPSAGHDMTAPDFESFVAGLVDESGYDVED